MRDIFSRVVLQALVAELVGTFFLTLAALVSGSPYAVALTLTAFVYATGAISGCNVNPAVTVGLVVARQLPLITGCFYIYVQIVGALLARVLAPLVGAVPSSFHAASAVAECLGGGALVLVVVAVSDKHVPKAGSGVAVGAVLASGLLTTKGILNPAVAVAMGQFLSPATWATIAGGLIFVLIFRFAAPKDQPQQSSTT